MTFSDFDLEMPAIMIPLTQRKALLGLKKLTLGSLGVSPGDSMKPGELERERCQ